MLKYEFEMLPPVDFNKTMGNYDATCQIFQEKENSV